MAIEEFGESLLSQARDKRKKEDDKGKKLTALVLGLTAGNAFLRNRAAKRIEKMNTTNAFIIRDKTKQFDNGIKFWTDHSKLMDKHAPTGSTDWKQAKRNELYDLYKKTDLQGEDAKNYSEFTKLVDSKVADEIKSYAEKYELNKQFKDIDSGSKAKARETFLSPLQKKLELAKQTILNSEGSVGGVLFSQLGLRPDSKLVEDFEGTGLTLPAAFTAPSGYYKSVREQLLKEKSSIDNFAEAMSDADKNVTYTPLTSKEIKSLSGSSNAKPNAKHATFLNNILTKKGKSKLSLKENFFSKKKFSYTDGLEYFSGKPKVVDTTLRNYFEKLGNSEKELFISDILGISKVLEQNYEQVNDFDVKESSYFIGEAFNTYIEKQYKINDKPIVAVSEELDTFDENEIVPLVSPSTGETINLAESPMAKDYINSLKKLFNEKDLAGAKQYKDILFDNIGDYPGKGDFLIVLGETFEAGMKGETFNLVKTNITDEIIEDNITDEEDEETIDSSKIDKQKYLSVDEYNKKFNAEKNKKYNLKNITKILESKNKNLFTNYRVKTDLFNWLISKDYKDFDTTLTRQSNLWRDFDDKSKLSLMEQYKDSLL